MSDDINVSGYLFSPEHGVFSCDFHMVGDCFLISNYPRDDVEWVARLTIKQKVESYLNVKLLDTNISISFNAKSDNRELCMSQAISNVNLYDKMIKTIDDDDIITIPSNF